MVKKVEKKKGSLVIQIGTVFGIIFIPMILLFILIQVIGNGVTYFEAQREYLEPYMKNVQMQEEKYIPNLEWFVAFWREHPDEIKEEINNPSTDLEGALDESILYESSNITEADLEALPEDKKIRVATEAYRAFDVYIAIMQWQMTHERLFVVDVNKESLGFLYDLGEDVEYEGDPHLGENLTESVDDVPAALKDYSDGKSTEIKFERHDSRKDGTYYYMGYYPVVKNGKIMYVIGILHDWSDYHSTQFRNLVILVVINAVVIVLAGFILLHFVNRIAVKPLKKVQYAVRDYRKDKVSDDVIEKMNRIEERNELGELSNDISDLVLEIERYNEENSKLIGERKRVEAELSLASDIQNGVLPKVFPEEKSYQLFASMTPAKEVGGDYYDFFKIDDTHVGLSIGDVSGKGVPASLFMMITKMLIKQNAMAGNSPAEVLRRTNETLCAENKNDMFVTAWFGILDLTTGKIIAASAGHEFPLISEGGAAFSLLKDKHGFVLGGMDISKYKEYEIDLTPGSTLLVYTDGAPEATNASLEPFGTDRMLEALNQDPGLTPDELCGALTKAIDEFVGEAPQFDDLTMLCVRYHGEN